MTDELEKQLRKRIGELHSENETLKYKAKELRVELAESYTLGARAQEELKHLKDAHDTPQELET